MEIEVMTRTGKLLVDITELMEKCVGVKHGFVISVKNKNNALLQAAKGHY